MKRIKTFLFIFLFSTLVGVTSKVAFMLMYHRLLADASVADYLQVVAHGLRLDLAIAAYLTVVPGLLLIISLWCQTSILRWLWRGYFALTALAAALAYVANLGLYGYWGFPLDNTPLLYVKTSPADAMASLTWWQTVLAAGAIALVALPIYYVGARSEVQGAKVKGSRRVTETLLLLLMEAALLLPIRGGLGTGTNHTGSVYFSTNIRLNHAAVNPIFSFVEAVLHQEEIGARYRFMPDDKATRLLGEMTCTSLREHSEKSERTENLILIVLESFSDTLMRQPGIAPRLLQLADEGLYFTNFYASSFRTDRALVSIHSGLPSPPSFSLMDMPRKSTTLPAIAGTLARQGYHTTFYYGGDVNYSNMRSYLMGTGFEQVVCDADFPARLHTGKWGVADGPVYERMLADIKADTTGRPFFRSIMTESSHEPFDVPGYSRIAYNKVLNAFSYADDCLGTFINELKQLPCWQHTLVAIVPDHLGAWPDEVDNYALWRYRQPFIITGGAIDGPRQCAAIGSQTDIAATLLGMMGIDHGEFLYSKDLLDPAAPHFAFFTFPDAMGLVTDSGSVVFDNTAARLHSATGTATDSMLIRAKAYLQKLYDDLDKR